MVQNKNAYTQYEKLKKNSLIKKNWQGFGVTYNIKQIKKYLFFIYYKV